MYQTTMPRRFAALVLSALFAAVGSPGAQEPQTGQPPQSPRVLQAPPSLLHRFDVTRGTLQELLVPGSQANEVQIDVVLAGQQRQLRLRPHDVRTQDFRLLVANETGLHEVPAPPSVTWRGEVAGDADSVVAAALVDGSMSALIRLGNDAGYWAVQPVHPIDPSAGAAVHVVYHHADLSALPFSCGVPGPAQPGPTFPANGEDVNSVCELACEADYPYYQLNGSSVTNTQNDVTQVVNAVDAIYRADVQITYRITTIVVNSSPDPYSTTDPGTLLTQFRNYWNNFRGGVTRDLAHLFTGRSLNGSVIGIAYLGVVCATSSAYGLVESRFTSNLYARTGLSAHEIGHCWNAQHCDGSPDCRIMCSGLGGCSGILNSFSLGEKNQILAFKSSRGCLTLQSTQPVLTSMTPTSVKAFGPPLVTLTGTGLTGTTQVQVGTANVTTGFSVLSDTQLRFPPPQGLTIGPVAVRVVNPTGTSNSLNLTYTGTTPCELSVPLAGVGGMPLNFAFGGEPNHIWYLIVSLLSSTSPVQGWPMLDGASILSMGGLDAVGLGTFSIVLPSGVLNGITVRSQLLDVDPASLTLTSSSTVASTQIFF